MPMKSFPREAAQYAVLLVILFAIGALAVRATIEYVEGIHPGEPSGQLPPVTYAILALALGFMSIAGAFGLWAMRFSAEAETRRRIGRFVDAMDYLSDGLLAIGTTGCITGANPALKSLSGIAPALGAQLQDVFACLSDHDVQTLLDKSGPQELERDLLAQDEALHTLRFRSQPTEGIQLIIVSDVTARRAEEQRRQQVARLQMVGRIARGVAHDFNNILCAISGHNSLVRRLKPGSPEAADSMQAIARETDRGIALSRHMLDLSHTGGASMPTIRLAFYAHRAVELLQLAVHSGWKIEKQIDPRFPTVPFSGIQVEQLILNLGLLAIDTVREPGSLRVTLNVPSASDHLLNVDPAYAAVLVVSASVGSASPGSHPRADSRDDSSGIILSVVRSMIEAEGGSLEILSATPESALYKVLIPRSRSLSADGEDDLFPETLVEYVTGWQVLLAGSAETLHRIESLIRRAGAVIDHASTVVATLARAEANAALDIVILEESLLGRDTDAFVRALLKVRPSAGIIVLRTPDDHSPSAPLSARGVILESLAADPGRLLRAMIEAKGLAHRQA